MTELDRRVTRDTRVFAPVTSFGESIGARELEEHGEDFRRIRFFGLIFCSISRSRSIFSLLRPARVFIAEDNIGGRMAGGREAFVRR
jgi:hypothetical protein